MSTHLQQLALEALASRGVYEHPFTGPNGEHFFVGVDQHGVRCFELTVPARHAAATAAVAKVLRQVLNDLDPLPLQLMD